MLTSQHDRRQETSLKILLISPEYPDTFWSFKHALKMINKKAVKNINAKVEIFKVSCTTGEGVPAWANWLATQMKRS